MANDNDDEPEGDEWAEGRHGKCQACDAYGPVDDISLCGECGPRVERDLIRERAWDYTFLALAHSDAEREKARDAVIQKHGAALEILAPPADRSRRARGRRPARGRR